MRLPCPNVDVLRNQLVRLASESHYGCVLANCAQGLDRHGEWELLAGFADAHTQTATAWPAAAAVIDHPGEHNWWFGGLGYDLKNELEPSLNTHTPAPIVLPPATLFQAQRVVGLRRGENEFRLWGGWQKSAESWFRNATKPVGFANASSPQFESNFTRAAYLEAIRSLKAHIREGDVYEINLAQCFTALAEGFQPGGYWLRLLDRQPVPFAALLKWGSKWALGASPERFLRLGNGTLTTQPIKGTARRSPVPEEDARVIDNLATSEKERAENVMIVDLARNDLYRTCVPETVRVSNLFEVQTFATLHHLVSTIQGQLEPHRRPSEAVAAAFPPGSMTGAPKIRAMELIEAHEPHGRGLYAGGVGYVAPAAAGGGFDFNVVIRTLMHCAETDRLAYHVGGAITADSDPAAEYEETLTKALALRRAFG